MCVFQPDKEVLRSVKFNPGYDVTLTLVNPRPDVLDVQWDVETAIQGQLVVEKWVRL